jgi:hypothetical protein
MPLPETCNPVESEGPPDAMRDAVSAIGRQSNPIGERGRRGEEWIPKPLPEAAAIALGMHDCKKG